MFYRLSLEVLGLRTHLQKIEGIEFRLNAPGAALVQVSRDYPNGEKPSEPSSAICVGTTAKEIADDEVAAELKLAISASLDGVWVNFRNVTQGRMTSIYSVIDEVFEPLQAAMKSVVKIFRWREGLMEDPADPFRRVRQYCSLDGTTWFEVGTVRAITIRQLMGFRQVTASNENRKEIIDLMEARTEEPLGHQLFREAWNQKESNPRSALVIGVAAAEVGLKKLIGTLVPPAQWLVDEIQTPSLSKMLRGFLPTLPVKVRLKGKSLRPPNKLLHKLDKAVERRNDLVHAGKAPPNRDELEDMLLAVYDLLCICDMYVGHGWAHLFISSETLGSWKDE